MKSNEMKEIILAVITLAGSIFTTVWQNKKTRRRNSEENKEIKQTIDEK